jgi:hypothetical protein
MTNVDNALAKIDRVLREVANLRTSEFPYPDSDNALGRIEQVLSAHRGKLEQAKKEAADAKLLAQLCAEASVKVAQNLPLLGHVLRSTNVRNAFEFYGPLVRLARSLLGGDDELVLSSEWEFSPFAYPPDFPHLKQFVLVGLPASESGNALIVPLCGHELGHLIWRKSDHPTKFRTKVALEVSTRIEELWDEYKTHFPNAEKATLLTDGDQFARVTNIVNWALAQCEEMFCDFVGLRIFHEGYLLSLLYILAPYLGEYRSPNYPSMKDRIRYLSDAAAQYGVAVPNGYGDNFEDEPETYDDKDEFLLRLGDHAASKAAPDITKLANDICNAKGIPGRDGEKIDAVYNSFSLVLPAAKVGSLSAIVNGGWKAHLDGRLWHTSQTLSKRKTEILNELMLKSFEVLDVEYLVSRA